MIFIIITFKQHLFFDYNEIAHKYLNKILKQKLT